MFNNLRKIVFEEVKEGTFRQEMMPLDYSGRMRMERFINEKKEDIVKYEFGYVTGRRSFKVTMRDGKVQMWDFERKTPWHQNLRSVFKF